MDTEQYAGIILGLLTEQLDKRFQYRIPDHLKSKVHVGSVVYVPFGAGNKKTKGFVIDISSDLSFDRDKIKDISDVSLDVDVTNANLIELAYWMRDEYGSTINRALKTVFPIQDKVRNKVITEIILTDDHEKTEEYYAKCKKKNAAARLRLLEALMEHKIINSVFAKDKLKVTAKTISELKDEGIVSVKNTIQYRNPINVSSEKEELPELNDEQRIACDSISEAIEKNKHEAYLIHGITGSGKTRVYIELIKEVVAKGKQAIMLIPEIALTYQTVKRFVNVFGDRVSVLNSKMSPGERYDQFLRASNGDIDVMIGPRSAIFTPFNNIGIIVLDEEHEESYRNENTPCYDTREVAKFLTKKHNAPLVLASATPSVKSYYMAQKGEYKLLKLTKRATAGGQLANVHVVDMREELKAGNKTIFSRPLIGSLAERIADKEQSMLFLNKRGYLGIVSCRACGYVIKCPHCDISMTYHKNGTLVCHYCDTVINNVNVCPKCGSKYIAGFKAGTEKIEQEVKKAFPMARVLRMDRDTTVKKGAHDKILEEYANGDADILVGTQMIVKGHDFENCTLVGVLAADMTLFTSSYTASERTFQLITQSAGRAGRGEKRGDVYIQTYDPENPVILAAAAQDYELFYNEEIKHRQMLNFPPICKMATYTFVSENAEVLKEAMNRIREKLNTIAEKYGRDVDILGPNRGSGFKLKDEFNIKLIIKSRTDEILKEIKNDLEKYTDSEEIFKKIHVLFNRE